LPSTGSHIGLENYQTVRWNEKKIHEVKTASKKKIGLVFPNFPEYQLFQDTIEKGIFSFWTNLTWEENKIRLLWKEVPWFY
jgi:energy-coupling factor transporter ATP-binding protein EcfA2